jgi:molybdopterin-containing oxidoreductase family membrane subunit
VIGAVHSGIAAVVTGMTLLRKPLHLTDYFTPDLYDTIGRLQLVILLTYVFFAVTDFQFALFARDPIEISMWQLRLTEAPTSTLFYIHLATSIVIPFFVWISRTRRRNINLMFVTAILVNIGEWIEHYLDVVNPQDFKQAFVFMWVRVYQPHAVEYIITFGALAGVMLGVFVFAKVFPIVPLHPMKEGQVLKQQVRIGLADVPAAVHED